jgi:hypothetical protein
MPSYSQVFREDRLTLADRTYMLCRNVCNYHPTRCKIPENARLELQRAVKSTGSNKYFTVEQEQHTFATLGSSHKKEIVLKLGGGGGGGG